MREAIAINPHEGPGTTPAQQHFTVLGATKPEKRHGDHLGCRNKWFEFVGHPNTLTPENRPFEDQQWVKVGQNCGTACSFAVPMPLRPPLADGSVSCARRGFHTVYQTKIGDQRCIRREGASEAVRQAAGGGCRSGWGRLLSVTNAIEPGTWR